MLSEILLVHSHCFCCIQSAVNSIRGGETGGHHVPEKSFDIFETHTIELYVAAVKVQLLYLMQLLSSRMTKLTLIIRMIRIIMMIRMIRLIRMNRIIRMIRMTTMIRTARMILMIRLIRIQAHRGDVVCSGVWWAWLFWTHLGFR